MKVVTAGKGGCGAMVHEPSCCRLMKNTCLSAIFRSELLPLKGHICPAICYESRNCRQGWLWCNGPRAVMLSIDEEYLPLRHIRHRAARRNDLGSTRSQQIGRA